VTSSKTPVFCFQRDIGKYFQQFGQKLTKNVCGAVTYEDQNPNKREDLLKKADEAIHLLMEYLVDNLSKLSTWLHPVSPEGNRRQDHRSTAN